MAELAAIQNKAKRLYEYISEVFSIGLPEDRDVRDYKAELLWYADIHLSPQCKLKTFSQQPLSSDPPGNAWLWVKKEAIAAPPLLPNVLEGWVDVGKDPLKRPQQVKFRDFGDRQERFEDSAERVEKYVRYHDNDWNKWSEASKPIYLANSLYDQLFILHQRLSIEGDKFEVLWGHLFLTWDCENTRVCHPLFLTPLNLSFLPERRIIILTPSETSPIRFDHGCVRNLPLALGQQLHQLANQLNSPAMPVDVWDHVQMKALASQITGYIFNDAVVTMNRYEEVPLATPTLGPVPAIYNAPVIFVRARSSRKWVDDAKAIAEQINAGAGLTPFIQGLIALPGHIDFPDPSQFNEDGEDDDGENLLPLEYNEQQREIVTRLKQHYGVLVQGPPGTGKSHTIANIVSSLLARGKRVLVTSQTENALKVLRGHLPKDIQSLCVSQLGNDTDAKKYLDDAVTAVGSRLHLKNNHQADVQIKQIKIQLRQNREEQSILRNKIQDWAALDAKTFAIDGVNVTAHEAAKECAEKEQAVAWFPDTIAYEIAPPLDDAELSELCQLLKTHNANTRSAVIHYFPEPTRLLKPERFAELLSQLTACQTVSRTTAEKRQAWSAPLRQADATRLTTAQRLFEEADAEFSNISAVWLQAILNVIAVNPRQNDYWRNVVNECSKSRDEAWQCYNEIQRHQILIPDNFLSPETSIALSELNRLISSGSNPGSWFCKLRLSKPAKQLLSSMSIDGKKIVTSETVKIALTCHRYRILVSKIVTYWNQSILQTGGPRLNSSAGMLLQDIDTSLSALNGMFKWYATYYRKISDTLVALGYQKQTATIKEAIALGLEIINGQICDNRGKEIEEELNQYKFFLTNETRHRNASPLLQEMTQTVSAKSIEAYHSCYRQISHYCSLYPAVRRIEELTSRLKAVAPRWCAQLVDTASIRGAESIRVDWRVAWRWQRLSNWLTTIHNLASVDSLQGKLEITRRKECELITQLVVNLSWQRQIASVDDGAYRALVAWKQAMANYGAGTGKHAQRWINEAALAMKEAVRAVPVWIMPLHKVIDSFAPAPGIFDVVIVDEASQCDLRSLSVLYRAKKVLVVGDPEQISPSNIGVKRDMVLAAIENYISDVQNATVKFYIDNSLFQIAEYSLQRTLLTEHFRCVPQIIEFNNWLCPSYGGKLEPLRQPNPAERLDPPIVTVFVNNGHKKDNDVNEQEAEALVAKLLSCCKDGRYRDRTMGVISLLGEKQAKHISGLIASQLSEVEIEKRRIICGDAYAFQGDERNVMFISLVIAGNAHFASLTRDNDRRRFNVATSRAKDQVFLFHSINLGQIINQECVRYKLLNWYLNPAYEEMKAGLDELRQKKDSDFELEVGERIIRRGHKVFPQYRPFASDAGYRIDLVVQGEKSRLAVECDGDRWHGPERWEYDQRREAQLRRAGWKFWRISGSAFYRNKDTSLDGLWSLLAEMGIEPLLLRGQNVPPQQFEGDSHSSADVMGNDSQAEDVNEVLQELLPDNIIEIDTVNIGDSVKVYDEVTDRVYHFKIGLDKDGQGYVSPDSSVGKALIGIPLNQTVEIQTPTGLKFLKVVEIKHNP